MKRLAALRYLTCVLMIVDDIIDKFRVDPTKPDVWANIEVIVERLMMRRRLL
jgi:hypothetical protein